MVSAVLIDPQYGADAIAAVPASTRLIVAADTLVQKRGGLVTGSEINRAVTREYVESVGADALKLLIIWQDHDRAERDDLACEFVELCRGFGGNEPARGCRRPADGRGLGGTRRKARRGARGRD